jgi:hypothetical protein
MKSRLIGAADGIVAGFGFFLVYGVSGAIDTATDSQLLPLCAVAGAGLGLLFAGINGLTRRP